MPTFVRANGQGAQKRWRTDSIDPAQPSKVTRRELGVGLPRSQVYSLLSPELDLPLGARRQDVTRELLRRHWDGQRYALDQPS
jgi:hypothetical protein